METVLKPKLPHKNRMMKVYDFAKAMGVHPPAVYKRIQTPETPDGKIIPELHADDRTWLIDYNRYKDIIFKKQSPRTKVVAHETK